MLFVNEVLPRAHMQKSPLGDTCTNEWMNHEVSSLQRYPDHLSASSCGTGYELLDKRTRRNLCCILMARVEAQIFLWPRNLFGAGWINPSKVWESLTFVEDSSPETAPSEVTHHQLKQLCYCSKNFDHFIHSFCLATGIVWKFLWIALNAVSNLRIKIERYGGCSIPIVSADHDCHWDKRCGSCEE